MQRLTKINNKVIDNLLALIVVFVSITGWYSLDYIGGMSMFWGIFILVSIAIFLLVVIKCNIKIEAREFFRKKFNILFLLYLTYMSISYLCNYQGMSTILYICKMWVIVIVYYFIINIYMSNILEDGKKNLINRMCKYIFILGSVHVFLGMYQYIILSNDFLWFTLTTWPAYNPASLYGNVNGLGTYLFISIAAGFYCVANTFNNKYKTVVVFFLVAQMYMLYLTIARTSIVVTILYVCLVPILFFIKDKKIFYNVINRKTLITIVISYCILLSIVNYAKIGNFVESIIKPNTEHRDTRKQARKTIDMLDEKNSKGFNQRQFIWKAVIKDYKQYIVIGDGLKYNIVNKINVEEVISKRSKGVTRISYHNTLFRYFASNGLIGLGVFLILYAFIPLSLLLKMIKEKRLCVKYSMVIIFMACIFLYMQMEEVYLGEIGFVPMVLLIVMAYANTLLSDEVKSS